MTAELQDLSREAARKLPDDSMFSWKHYFVSNPHWLNEYVGRVTMTQDKYNGKLTWLHEDTEACAEIMVRLLQGMWAFVLALMQRLIKEGVEQMQAFRTAVLRAVVAL